MAMPQCCYLAKGFICQPLQINQLPFKLAVTALILFRFENRLFCPFLFSDPQFQWGGKSSSVLRFFPNSAKSPRSIT